MNEDSFGAIDVRTAHRMFCSGPGQTRLKCNDSFGISHLPSRKMGMIWLLAHPAGRGTAQVIQRVAHALDNRFLGLPSHRRTSLPCRSPRYPIGEWGKCIWRTYYIHENSRFDQVYNFAGAGVSNVMNMRLGIEMNAWSAILWVTDLADDDTPGDIMRNFPDRTFSCQTSRHCPEP